MLLAKKLFHATRSSFYKAFSYFSSQLEKFVGGNLYTGSSDLDRFRLFQNLTLFQFSRETTIPQLIAMETKDNSQ